MGTSPADPARYNSFLVDLLGVMAYGELSAFERLSSDARYSPTLHDRAVLGRIAVIEFQHYELVSAQLAEMGVDLEVAMLPFQPSVDHFHERTRPADWFESLMKAYVIDTVSADFYRAVALHVDASPACWWNGSRPMRRPPRCCGTGSRTPLPTTRGWRPGWRCGRGGCWGRP